MRVSILVFVLVSFQLHSLSFADSGTGEASSVFKSRTLTPFSQFEWVTPSSGAEKFGSDYGVVFGGILKVNPQGSDFKWRTARITAAKGLETLDNPIANSYGSQYADQAVSVAWQALDDDRILSFYGAGAVLCSFSKNHCQESEMFHSPETSGFIYFSDFKLRPDGSVSVAGADSSGAFNGKPAWAAIDRASFDINSLATLKHEHILLPVDASLGGDRGFSSKLVGQDDAGNTYVLLYVDWNSVADGASANYSILKVTPTGSTESVSFNPSLTSGQVIQVLQAGNGQIAFDVRDVSSKAETVVTYNAFTGKSSRWSLPGGEFISGMNASIHNPGRGQDDLLVFVSISNAPHSWCMRRAIDLATGVPYLINEFQDTQTWGCDFYQFGGYRIVGLTSKGSLLSAGMSELDGTTDYYPNGLNIAHSDGSAGGFGFVPSEVASYYKALSLQPLLWATTYQPNFGTVFFGNSGTSNVYQGGTISRSSAFRVDAETGAFIDAFELSADPKLDFPQTGGEAGKNLSVIQISKNQALVFEALDHPGSTFRLWGLAL